MVNSIAVYAILYALFTLCIIFPPNELISAGLTVEHIFQRFLGQEHVNFVEYHIRRTTLNLFVHSLLPLFFFVLLIFYEGETVLSNELPDLSFLWLAALALAVFVPLIVSILIFYWAQNGWSRHPLVKTLTLYDTQWRSVAAVINTEFRRFDKFHVNLSGLSRVIVTDSWIIVTGPYRVYVSQQGDVRVTITRTDEHQISPHGETGAQFLTITVENIIKPIRPFSMRLNALDYRDLRAKLQSPIQHARDIIIQASLSERFVQAFVQHAMENPRFPMEQEARSALEPCIGCMQETANVKLEKMCLDAVERHVDDDGHVIPHCVRCYCRPMWCVPCMGRWFASRQDQRRPDSWLGGKSPCPTCRATFCMLDVCVVQELEGNDRT